MPDKKHSPNLDFLDSASDPRAALRKIIAFEAWGIIVLALTIVYILGLSGRGGLVGETLIVLIKPLLGDVGAWLIAVALVTGTVHLLAAGKIPFAPRLTRLAFWAIPLILAAWENAMYSRIFYWDLKARDMTGWIGLLAGRLLRLLVGDSAVAVSLVLLVVMTFVILRLSPKAVLISAWKALKKIAVRPRPMPARPKFANAAAADTETLPLEIAAEAEVPVPEPSPVSEAAPPPQPVAPPGSQLELALDEPAPLPRQRLYKLPPMDLLDPPSDPVMDDAFREFAAQRIIKTLETFGIPCQVCDVITGPAVTRVEVVLGEGIRVKQIEGMEKDIAYTLPAKRVRVEAPIPGKTAVGIEFPNSRTNLVRLRELVGTPEWQKARAPLTMALAKNLNNQPVLADLGKMPHLLVAGQTGSGKSVCLHGIIMSLLFRLTPDQLKLILIDPKMVEFGFYEGLPHLLTPVVNEINDAINALRWSIQEMRTRYRKLKAAQSRNIQIFNRTVPPDERMPFIVIVIDEMSDLMAQEGYEIETCITALTQLARAVGIHLILATQRPSVKIITGNIKANIPARIAFNVASQIDSRTILDHKGAENLLGNGDMLFKPIDAESPTRAQGVYVDDDEIRRIVRVLSQQGTPEYDEDVTAEHGPSRRKDAPADPSEFFSQEAQLFKSALKVFLAEGEASTSMLQTRLAMGYPKARRVMEQMEEMGLVGPKNGSKPREIIYSACRKILRSINGEGDDIAQFEVNPAVASGVKVDGSDDDDFDDNNIDQILAEV